MKRRLFAAMLCVLLILTTVIAPIGASAAKTVKILKVTVDGARVRKGPSSAYEVITSVKKGGRVFYLGKKANAFVYVRTSTGKVGYMYKGFLKAYGVAPVSQIYYAKKAVKVYKKPSTSSKKVTRLAKNQHVIVYKVKGNWAYIKTLSGKGGYVQKKYLKKAM